MTLRLLHGKAHGKTIELDEDLGLAEGQEVEISVRPVPATRPTPGEGFIRTEGALKEDPWWDDVMDEIHRARKIERRTVTDEP